jgi:hypothetical protein
MMYNLDTRGLLIKEEPVVLVAEDQDVETARFQVSKIIQPEFLRQCNAGQNGEEQDQEDPVGLLAYRSDNMCHRNWVGSIPYEPLPHDTLRIFDGAAFFVILSCEEVIL